MSARLSPAGPLEITIASGHAVLARLQLIAVHRNAHGAAGFSPIGARVAEKSDRAPQPALALSRAANLGPTITRTPGCTLRPRKISAAERRSEIREFDAASDEDHVYGVAPAAARREPDPCSGAPWPENRVPKDR